MVTRLFLWSLLLVFALPAQAQSLSAFVDRNEISIDDVLTLTIRVDAGLGNTRPSLASLNNDFEQEGGISTRSTYTNNNGDIQSWTEYSIMLRPRSVGTLTIPAFRIGPETSVPIRITVGEATELSGNGNEEIFLESEVSKEQLYVQEQLLYTIRIYYSIGFDQGAQLTSPQVADAVVQQLGSDENFQRVVDGIGYNVTERRFVIFPQSSGQLTIPPVHFSASIGRRSGINRFLSNRGAMREINLDSDAHTLEVLPRPANAPGQTWLPAAELTLEEEWSGELDNIEVGDAITRNITLTARGLSSSLLPGLDYEEQTGLKFYPDQPTREDNADREGVVGKRIEGTAIVASQPGEYLLPEVRLPWWNTTTNTMETAVLPARTLTVLAPPGGATAPTPPPGFVPIAGQNGNDPAAMMPASQTSGIYLFWISSTAFFATAWLLTVLLLLRSRRQLAYATLLPMTPQPTHPGSGKQTGTAEQAVTAAEALRVLESACRNGNLYDIRRAVLKWGQAFLGSSAPLTLERLGQGCGSISLTAHLEALDKTLYGGAHDSVDPHALYAEVAAIHKQGPATNAAHSSKYALPPLYRQ